MILNLNKKTNNFMNSRKSTLQKRAESLSKSRSSDIDRSASRIRKDSSFRNLPKVNPQYLPPVNSHNKSESKGKLYKIPSAHESYLDNSRQINAYYPSNMGNLQNLQRIHKPDYSKSSYKISPPTVYDQNVSFEDRADSQNLRKRQRLKTSEKEFRHRPDGNSHNVTRSESSQNSAEKYSSGHIYRFNDIDSNVVK